MAEGATSVGEFDLDSDQRRLVYLVYQRMRTAIREGLIRPEERLVQDELARRFQTSRSPIREAIVRLSQEGIVVLEPHRGAFVRQTTEQEMDQIYEVRSVLEPFAAAKAARLATDEDVERLGAIHREAVERRDAMDQAGLFHVND